MTAKVEHWQQSMDNRVSNVESGLTATNTKLLYFEQQAQQAEKQLRIVQDSKVWE